MDPRYGNVFSSIPIWFRISSISLVCPETLNFDVRNDRKKGGMKEFPLSCIHPPTQEGTVTNEALSLQSRAKKSNMSAGDWHPGWIQMVWKACFLPSLDIQVTKTTKIKKWGCLNQLLEPIIFWKWFIYPYPSFVVKHGCISNGSYLL